MKSRDNFPLNVVRALASRAGNRCSNPDCRRETSGPDSTPDGAVNVGVGAHITAAAPGGPRFDAGLSPAQRSAAPNGIWLCQWCGKLVDDDPARFTVTLLQDWKTGAEGLARSLLVTPERSERIGEPLLVVPSADRSAAWLSFSARVSTLVGRDREREQLEAFLHSDTRFSWWLVTGPAGSGKSRLALDLCLAVRPAWNAGFLSRVGEFRSWSHFRPARPTLIVVDYVASRATEVSAILLELTQSVAHLPHPVRVLLLEREEGAWWSLLLRKDSHSEAAELAAWQHHEPLHLGPLRPSDLFAVATDVAELRGVPWKGTTEELFARRMLTLDPLGRPLFGMIGADSFRGETPNPLADSTALQRVLERELARWRQIIVDDERRHKFENLVILATLVGGVLPRSGSFSYLAGTDVAALLPNPDLLDFDEYNGLVGAASSEATLPGLQPDVLGERLALDRLTAGGGVGRAARRLLLTAWNIQPDGLCDFVVRAASDYPGDAALDAVLWDLPLESPEARRLWGGLAGELVRVVNRTADPRTQRLLKTLRELARDHEAEAPLRVALARAELYLGHVFFLTEDAPEEAAVSYEAALALAEPDSEIAASAINNRGILRSDAEDAESAFADWSRVITMNQASEEVRACALNNRADVFARRGAHDDAVRDRTEVLRLRETSHNRRYIALTRRSSSYLALGRAEDALRDLDTILVTPDIVPEQKANAMVDKGLILRDLARLDEARRSFEDALLVDLVFAGTYARVLVELAELARLEREPDRARGFLDAAAAERDASSRVVVEALLVHARLLADAGDQVGAERILQSVLGNPNATPWQKTVADRLRVAATSIPQAPP